MNAGEKTRTSDGTANPISGRLDDTWRQTSGLCTLLIDNGSETVQLPEGAVLEVLQKLIFRMESRLEYLQESVEPNEPSDQLSQAQNMVVAELSEMLKFSAARARLEANKHAHTS